MAASQSFSRRFVTPDRAGLQARTDAEAEWRKREAQAVGRRAWEESTNTGRNLAARSPQEVMALGRQTLAARPARQVAGGRSRSALPSIDWNEVGNQGMAALRGGEDALTFGLGDNVLAGGKALVSPGGLAGAAQRYQANLAAEKALDRHDAQHYGLARGAGEVLGTGAQFLAMGPLGSIGAAGRLAETTPLLAREVGAMTVGGAGLGAGGQAASDLASGHLSSLGDYAGAAAGGAADLWLTRRLGYGRGGAASGALTSFLQDALSGRAPSVERVTQGANSGGYAAGVAGALGRNYARALSRVEKGKLGEELSELRSWLRLEKPIRAPKSREQLPSGKYTYPDHRTNTGVKVEAKFGPSARLSRNQREAYRTFPTSDFRIDHFLPEDVGNILSVPASMLGFDVLSRYDVATTRHPGRP